MSSPEHGELLAGGRDVAPRRLPRWARPLLAVAAVGAIGAALASAAGSGPPPEPLPELRVLDDGIGVTTSGVIVLSVELRDRGGGVEVRSAELTASPVLQPASVNAPPRVRAGRTGRLVVIVQPDCRALGPAQDAALDAELVVRVVSTAPTASRAVRELRLDLRDDPVLLGRLRGLCADRAGQSAGLTVEAVAATFDRVEAAVGVRSSDAGPGSGAVEVRAVGAPGLAFDGALPAPVGEGPGNTLRLTVTVADCTAISRPPPGSDPVAHLWGWPELELARADGSVVRVRPEPAAVSELYSTAVRRIVESSCDGPPR